MSSNYYAVVRASDGAIVNRIVLEQGTPYTPETGHTLVLDNVGYDIGGTYVDGRYTPPTPPPPPSLDPADYPLTARQLRLGLVRNGVPLSAVQTAIDGIPDAATRDEAQIYWEFSSIINWSHPMTQSFIGLVGLTQQQASAMWLAAKDYEA